MPTHNFIVFTPEFTRKNRAFNTILRRLTFLEHHVVILDTWNQTLPITDSGGTHAHL